MPAIMSYFVKGDIKRQIPLDDGNIWTTDMEVLWLAWTGRIPLSVGLPHIIRAKIYNNSGVSVGAILTALIEYEGEQRHG